MIYVLEVLILIFAFYICAKERKTFQKCIADKEYNQGVLFCLNPLRGDKAVRISKVGLLLVNCLPWALLIVIILFNLKFIAE